MLSIERRNKILKMLRENGTVTVKELSSLFNVTEMTISRDLKYLGNQNLLDRTHGGAIFQKKQIGELKFSERISSRIKEKEVIARRAVEYIDEGDSLILYGGTTSIVLAREIARKNIRDITVVTNSDYIINELKMLPDITLINTGGQYIPKLGLYSGIYAEMILSEIRVSKFIFSAAGASLEDGLTDSEPSEINLKNKMFKISKENILIITSDKFNYVSTHRVASLEVVDRIITDSNISEENIKKIKKTKIKLDIVSI